MNAPELVSFISEKLNEVSGSGMKTYNSNGRLVVTCSDGTYLQLSVTNYKPSGVCHLCRAILRDREEGPICIKCDK